MFQMALIRNNPASLKELMECQYLNKSTQVWVDDAAAQNIQWLNSRVIAELRCSAKISSLCSAGPCSYHNYPNAIDESHWQFQCVVQSSLISGSASQPLGFQTYFAEHGQDHSIRTRGQCWSGPPRHFDSNPYACSISDSKTG